MPEDLNSEGGVPPIVLLVMVQDARREAYVAVLERAGFWVASSGSLRGAVREIVDLRPDVVVAGISAQDRENEEGALSHALEASFPSRAVPLLFLENEDGASAEAVLQAIERAIATSCQERPCAMNNGTPHSEVLTKSDIAFDTEESKPAIHASASSLPGACPACERPLVWTERAELDGIEYDYYDWCPNGCGLFCFDVARVSWVKLA